MQNWVFGNSNYFRNFSSLYPWGFKKWSIFFPLRIFNSTGKTHPTRPPGRYGRLAGCWWLQKNCSICEVWRSARILEPWKHEPRWFVFSAFVFLVGNCSICFCFWELYTEFVLCFFCNKNMVDTGDFLSIAMEQMEWDCIATEKSLNNTSLHSRATCSYTPVI